MTGIATNSLYLSSYSCAYSYSNADTQKESILNDNKKKSGIYAWVHIESGKKYVGSSVDLYRRFTQYFNVKYLTRTSKSSYICRALLKDGYSKFSLDILELCDTSILIQREQYYIDRPLLFFLKKKKRLINNSSSKSCRSFKTWV